MKRKNGSFLVDAAKVYVIIFLSHFFSQIIYNKMVFGLLDLRRGAILELVVMPACLTLGLFAGALILRLPIGGKKPGRKADG